LALAFELLNSEAVGIEVTMKRATIQLLLIFLSVLVLHPASSNAQQQTNYQHPFPVPAGLDSSVEFWKKVFSEYGQAQLIYFDPIDPAKIYEVMDVGEESRSNQYINSERARIAEAHGVDIERVKAQRGIKERTAAGIKRSGRYIAQIQQIFRDRGLPAELSYLPVVESSYDINARSSVGALGIWQFMPRTGREYMRVNAAVDERRDPIESSRAAASYLKQAYDYLGSWPLAITSYNYGQGGMARAVAAVGSNNLVDIIRSYQHPYFGFAPKHFYAEFIAAVEVASDLPRYFPGLELDAAAPIQERELTANTTLASLTGSTGLSKEELLAWNPALSASTKVVPAGYRVKLPVSRDSEPLVAVAQAFQVTAPSNQPQQKSVSAPARETAQVVHHKVKRGETLFQIAKRYGASVQNILQANGIRQAHMVRVGTTLVIPKV
jgi:membrane-bound lytic murein transglycosylase D